MFFSIHNLADFACICAYVPFAGFYINKFQVIINEYFCFGMWPLGQLHCMVS